MFGWGWVCYCICVGDIYLSVLEMGMAAKKSSSANKRPVRNIGSPSSRTRLRGASNVAANRDRVAGMQSAKKAPGKTAKKGYTRTTASGRYDSRTGRKLRDKPGRY